MAERFHLTRSEQQRLITFDRSEALVLAGEKRVIITIPASPREHALITTNPVELAEQAHSASRHRDGIDAEMSLSQESIHDAVTMPLHLQQVPEDAAGFADASNSNGHRGIAAQQRT